MRAPMLQIRFLDVTGVLLPWPPRILSCDAGMSLKAPLIRELQAIRPGNPPTLLRKCRCFQKRGCARGLRAAHQEPQGGGPCLVSTTGSWILEAKGRLCWDAGRGVRGPCVLDGEGYPRI